ncbi:MAG: calcium-binding protein, partial [Hyphomicrobium sp.]
SLSSIGNGTGAGGDVLVSIENAQGTDFADTLSGSAVDNFLIGRGGGDKLFGRAGNDQLQGGGGADWLDGGEGSDWAMYDDSETRVTINLLTNVHALGAAGDKLFSIENVQGSAFNDSITGNTVDNLLLGGAGDDGLFGGLGNDQLRGGLGKDTLDGGAGNSDWALYRDGATQGITLFLADNTANARGAFGDRLFNIENVQGTEFADLIHGNAAANVLAGNGGDDVLYGEGGGDNLSGGLGGDQIHGGGGDDVLFGGAGNDHLFDEEAANAADSDTFLPGAGADTVTGDGNDTVEYSDAAAGVAVDLTQTGAGQTGGAPDGDTLTGILGIAGSGFNDTLISSLTGNGADIAVLRGFAGSDSITLNHNFDQAFGGDDADTIVLKAASQTANGGDGNDVLVASLATAARLIGGAGSDTLTGNATAIDQFVIEKVSGVDTITNFLQSGQSGAGRDLLVLSLSGFGLGATFEAGELVSSGTGAAVGAAAQLIYNETTHELWFDADGTTAVEAAMKLALLQNAPAHLTLADFGVLA